MIETPTPPSSDKAQPDYYDLQLARIAKTQAELNRMLAMLPDEIAKVKAEGVKLEAEVKMIGRQHTLAPWTLLIAGAGAGAALVGAGAAATKLWLLP